MLENGRGWGQDVSLLPSRRTFTHATAEALTDPWTWVPATLAAVLVVTDWDEEISDWAIEETPVFGSNESASDASDDLRAALLGSALVTSLATDSGERASDWIPAKLKGVALAGGTIWATDTITDVLKDETERMRPDGSNTRSFPSLHSSQAFVSAAWSAHNLDSIRMSPSARTAARAGLVGAAVLTGWARVEAGAHYPADVLAGVALGNFMAHFANEALLGLPRDSVQWIVDPVAGDYGLMFSWQL